MTTKMTTWFYLTMKLNNSYKTFIVYKKFMNQKLLNVSRHQVNLRVFFNRLSLKKELCSFSVICPYTESSFCT